MRFYNKNKVLYLKKSNSLDGSYWKNGSFSKKKKKNAKDLQSSLNE